ncbi:MAG: ABC transporter permease [Clostridia bacterium]|nr:ABC transporter permease [Clostridia bacterium]
MGNSSSLTLEEYETYATADSVSDFYYSTSVNLNGSDAFLPVSNDTTNDSSDNEQSGFPGGMGGFPGGMGGGFSQIMGMQSDFTVVGYSGEAAMTAFLNDTASVTDGEWSTDNFASDAANCLISQELATYNDLAVGDTVTVTNPNNEEETYSLTVVGIYTDSSANENSFSMMGSTATDPANQIYMSYAALQAIVDASAEASETVTDEDTGREFETGLSGQLSATYEFATTNDYYLFEEQVRDLGLEDSYTVSSSDLIAFENSLTPLNTLSDMAKTFLIVILIIGAIILVVLNIFNVRERKYEIGVLTAMGMKKGKVATQFLVEIFAVTLSAVLIGACVGAVFSVPVTNALLENQISSQQSQSNRVEENFGRPGGGMGGGMGGNFSEPPDGMFGGSNPFANMFGGSAETNYVTSVSSAMDLTVVGQMLLIAVLLTLVSGMVSMLFVMRYEPLKILANRD